MRGGLLTGGHGRRLLLPCLCLLFLAAGPSSASAVRYVDGAGNDMGGGNPCGSPSTPCQTIAHAIGEADPAETIQVDSGTFSENVVINQGNSLVAQNFDGTVEPRPMIDGGAGVGINIIGGTPTISGFTIRGDANSIRVIVSATISGNTFDEGTPSTTQPIGQAADVYVDAPSNAVTIQNNTFTDPSPTDDQSGIFANLGTVTISGNTITNFRQGIESTANTTILDNTITGLHTAIVGGSLGDGAGIAAYGNTFEIRRNTISLAASGTPYGMYFFDYHGDGVITQVVMERNQVYGQGIGVFAADMEGGFTMRSDVIANNTNTGLSISDADNTDQLTLDATGLTAFNNGTDISLFDSSLTLGSSIVDDPIDVNSILSVSTCTITFSRGPTTSGNSCQTFQTSATPGFVDPPTNNFHLMQSSPLIDIGNPAPVVGSDIDGDARQLDGNCDGVVRRDMGADEVVRDCTPPTPPTPPGPEPTPTPPAPDTDPPDTFFKKAPKGHSDDTTPTFKFGSDEPDSTFKCRLDREKFTQCKAKLTIRTGIGKHVMRVVAVDQAGNQDPTAAKRAFTITG